MAAATFKRCYLAKLLHLNVDTLQRLYYRAVCMIINQASVFFLGVASQPGLATLPAPNHVFMLQRYNGDLLYVNPTNNFTVTRLLTSSRSNVSNLKFENFKIATFKKSIPETAFDFELSVQREIFSVSNLKIENDQNLTKSIKHSNVENSKEAIEFYFWQVYRYIRGMRPIAVYDVKVIKEPRENPYHYGKPMYCHNMIGHLLGLDIGNILTTKHLKHRLLKWSGKTNFITTPLWERTQTEEEKILGMVEF